MDHWIPEAVAQLVFPFHMLLLTALENGNTDFSSGSPRLQGQPCITTAGSTDTVQSDYLLLMCEYSHILLTEFICIHKTVKETYEQKGNTNVNYNEMILKFRKKKITLCYG